MTATIVRAAVHPGVGVARLGTSDIDHLFAPQVPFPPPRAADSSHDGQGRLKREAVEFRVYGYDADDNVVAELTADNAEIRWTAHVANAKAGWFKFRNAMDIPTLAATVVMQRNPDIVDPQSRRALIIDPGPRSISGRSQTGAAAARFDTGAFQGLPVFLGELNTDAAGRLIFLPGFGFSSSPEGLPPYVEAEPDAFGNATGWHDDAADGPVDAEVVIEGRPIPTTGAWVVSAPPSYAPDLKSWRTLYDLVREVYVRAGWWPRAASVSFTKDVHPLLSRLTGLQWTSSAYAAVFGHGAPFDFEKPDLLDKLCRIHGGASDIYRSLRTAVARMFRTPADGGTDPSDWPWLYGDSYDGTGAGRDPSYYFAVGADRLRILTAWEAGKFQADWGQIPAPPSAIDHYPVADQPAALDRAAMEFCAADAFHPGIELTWPMRHASIWAGPFRIARAAGPEPEYGPTLDVPRTLGADGPLHGQFAGSLTRWMLLPWQVDTGGCLAGYEDRLTYDAPSFWPARVPNRVLAQADYLLAIDPSAPPADRASAFAARRSWFTPLGLKGIDWGAALVTRYGGMGVLEARPGPLDDIGLPTVIYTETLPAATGPAGTFSFGATLARAAGGSEADRAAQAQGFADETDRAAVRRMRFGH